MTAANESEREELKEEPLWLWRPPEGGYIGRRGLRPKEAPEKSPVGRFIPMTFTFLACYI